VGVAAKLKTDAGAVVDDDDGAVLLVSGALPNTDSPVEAVAPNGEDCGVVVDVVGLNEKPLPALVGVVVLGVVPKLKLGPVPIDVEDVETVDDDGFAKLKTLFSLAFEVVVVPKALAVFKAPNGEVVLIAPNGEDVLPDAPNPDDVFV